MEIPTMISSAQIPQSPAGSGAADEAGMTPGRSGESSFFGLLFARKGWADGKEGSQALPQVMANLVPDGTPAMATSPGNAVGRPSEQAAVADAQVAETGMKKVRGEGSGLKVAEGLAQPGGKGVPTLLTLPENAALVQLPGDGPTVTEKGRSADSPRSEEAEEACGEKGEKAAVRVPLFTAIIPFLVGNPARPEQADAAAPTQTEVQAADAEGAFANPSAQSALQGGDTKAEVVPLSNATDIPLGETGTAPDPGTITGTALAKGGVLSPGEPAEKAPVAANQGGDGKAAATAAAKAVLPRVEGDIREVRDMPISATKGKGDESAVSEADSRMVKSAAEKVAQAPLSGGNRRIGEAAENAYKAALEQGGNNNGKNAPISDNAVQGKAPAGIDAAFASAGMAPERAEIVAAAKWAGARGEQGESPTRKTEEVKGSTTIGVTLDVAQPRGAAESRSLAQAPAEKIPSAEQIVNQVKEKLEAAGRVADDGRITLKLHPQELGELKISMRLDDHNLKVEIVTQNPSVKEALMQNLDTLKETLSRQNIAMERFDVSADLRQGFSQGGREERQMTQNNRGMDSGYPYGAEVEDEVAAAPNHPWESDNSLVNLML